MPAPALTSSTIAQKCLTCPSFLRGACQGMKAPVRCLATEIPLDRRGKREGNISHAFTSFSGKKAAPLPERYRLLKKNLTAGREEALQKSWDDLVEVLKERTEEVATKRERVSILHRQVYKSLAQAGNTVPVLYLSRGLGGR